MFFWDITTIHYVISQRSTALTYSVVVVVVVVVVVAAATFVLFL
jgi:hypothetical protein